LCVCAKGNYASRENDVVLVCKSCPPRSTTLFDNAQNISACVCNDGFWKPFGGKECLTCPVHALCIFGQSPKTKQGYWKVPWRNEILDPTADNATLLPRLQCLEETACLGATEADSNPLTYTNTSVDTMEGCAPFYNPPLCAACQRGAYKEAASFGCLKCYDNANDSIGFMFLVVTATLAVIAGFTYATVKDGGKKGAVDVVILKIAVNSGIISAGASAFPLAWPSAVVTMFQMYAIASASAIGDSLSADCVLRASAMRPVQAWALTMVVIPPGVILLWAVVYGFTNVFSGGRENHLTHHLPVATIITLIFAHPVVTKSAVKLVACRNVAGRSFLDADFNISCDSKEYYSWMMAVSIPLFLCFTFGVPLLYALAMYRHVRKDALTEHRDIYGFFFSGFRKGAWWFELWNTLRKSLFTISAVLFAPVGVMMQTWAALVLLLLYVVIFVLSQPYEESYLNHLERAALSINVLTLLLGLGLFTNVSVGESKSQELSVIITVVILGLNLYFMMVVVWTLTQHSQYCHVCKRNKNEKEQATETMRRPTRVHNVIRKYQHQQTIKGSLKYNVKVAVLMSNAKRNADKHLETRSVRLKARKIKQSDARLR
jgi:hypothetical protein